MLTGPLKNASPQKRPITAVSILSASLLGLVLACLAGIVMPGLLGHHETGAAFADAGWWESICSSKRVSTSQAENHARGR